MADVGYLRRVAKSVPDEATRKALLAYAESLAVELDFGAPDHQQKARNFQMYFVEGTTSTTVDQEFSIVHGLKRNPVLVFQALNPQTVNTQAVRLKVTRAADSNRLYLSSPDAGAPITLLVQ